MLDNILKASLVIRKLKIFVRSIIIIITTLSCIASTLSFFGYTIPLQKHVFNFNPFVYLLIFYFLLFMLYWLVIDTIANYFQEMVVVVQSIALTIVIDAAILVVIKSSFKVYLQMTDVAIFVSVILIFIMSFFISYSVIIQNFLRKTFESSSIGSKVFKLDKGNPCIIVFTHRNDVGSCCKEARALFGKIGGSAKEGLDLCNSDRRSCKNENLSPAIPKDEEEMISLIDHWARSVGVYPEKICSCEAFNFGGHNEPIFNEKLFKGKMVIVLGDSKNSCTSEFQKRYISKDQHLYWEMIPRDNMMRNSGFRLKHERFYSEMDDHVRIYYGLVTITKNPLDSDYDLIILAGSRTFGQKAITKWFKNKNNQQKILDEYKSNRRYTQFIIKGTKNINNEIADVTLFKIFSEVKFDK